MRKIRLSTNFAVFLLFFGVAALEAFQTANWAKAAFWVAIGILISSAWCVACTIAFIIFPDFASTVNLWWFDSLMSIFEIVLSFWLLFKGLRPSGRILKNQTN